MNRSCWDVPIAVQHFAACLRVFLYSEEDNLCYVAPGSNCLIKRDWDSKCWSPAPMNHVSPAPMNHVKIYVPVLKGTSGGPTLTYFYMIHRGGRSTFRVSFSTERAVLDGEIIDWLRCPMSRLFKLYQRSKHMTQKPTFCIFLLFLKTKQPSHSALSPCIYEDMHHQFWKACGSWLQNKFCPRCPCI